MRVYNNDITVADVYQLMSGEERRKYEVMPTWDILVMKLDKRSIHSDSFVDQYNMNPVNRVVITNASDTDDEKAVDMLIFINSDIFMKNDNKQSPIWMSAGGNNLERVNDVVFGTWIRFIDANKGNEYFIDRVILIDEGMIVQESSIEGQKLCIELYKQYFGCAPDGISIDFTSSSFHQHIEQKFYFGEEFREYLDCSDVDINDAICGYVSALIPLYVMDISYRNHIEAILYEGTGVIMRGIEKVEEERRNK